TTWISNVPFKPVLSITGRCNWLTKSLISSDRGTSRPSMRLPPGAPTPPIPPHGKTIGAGAWPAGGGAGRTDGEGAPGRKQPPGLGGRSFEPPFATLNI